MRTTDATSARWVTRAARAQNPSCFRQSLWTYCDRKLRCFRSNLTWLFIFYIAFLLYLTKSSLHLSRHLAIQPHVESSFVGASGVVHPHIGRYQAAEPGAIHPIPLVPHRNRGRGARARRECPGQSRLASRAAGRRAGRSRGAFPTARVPARAARDGQRAAAAARC